jgi:hypothetical protein
MKLRRVIRCLPCALVTVLFALPAAASPIGDPIDWETPIFHGVQVPTPPDTFNVFGNGGITTGFFSADSCIVAEGETFEVDASGNPSAGTGDYWIRYSFFPNPTCPGPPPTGTAFFETHDIEWDCQPGVPAQIFFWASSPLAVNAFVSAIVRVPASHQVDGCPHGFDVGVEFDQSIMSTTTGDDYIVQFGDPHGGGGALPAPQGYTLVASPTTPVKPTSWGRIKARYKD